MLFAGHDIEVTVRKGCKRLILRCREGRLYLSVPPRTPKAVVADFLAARRGWMDDMVRRTAVAEPAWTAGERHLVLGEYAVLGQDAPEGERALRAYRAAKLQGLVAELLPLWQSRMQVRPALIRYREMVSRWGSCQTATGKITLNLRLALVPPRCVEYVLVHELCHLMHPDHSPAFHARMTALMPDWQARKQQLSGLDLRPHMGQPMHIP